MNVIVRPPINTHLGLPGAEYMLRFTGNSYSHCDGIKRRTFLVAGAMGFSGLTLADMLRLEAAQGTGRSQKAIINVHLDGGPPQLDTIDMKMSAPTEIRGEFFPIATKLPGFQVCELMPKLAAQADQFTFIRSLVGSAGAHNAFQCQSGFPSKDLKSFGGRPAMGSIVGKLLGKTADVAPPFVDLMQGRPLVRNSARPGFLGPSFSAFRPDISKMFARELETGMKGELARLGGNHATSLKLNESLSADRLNSRTSLLSGLDRIKRRIDASGMMDAMDLNKEDPAVLARYTAPSKPDDKDQFATAEGRMSSRKFLLARRLVEAGVRCVSVSISDFDTHSKNFPRMKNLLPIVDHGLCTLVEDLAERGMLDDVSIVVWGEFGRTPRIDPKSGGRHHWPRVGPALLAGGGMKTGQVIGSTDRIASAVVNRPVHYKDIFATLYANLGIDALNTTLIDPQGRPQYLLDGGEPLSEV